MASSDSKLSDGDTDTFATAAPGGASSTPSPGSATLPAADEDGCRRLRLLLVGDLHLAVKRVADVGKWLVARDMKMDMVLCNGDFCNMTEVEQSDAAAVSVGEGDMSHLVSCLENLAPSVVYIPGNHDPVSTLAVSGDPPRLTTISKNLHMKTLQLAPGLRLVGFGGSIPAYQDGKQVWDGYPYTEEQLGEGVVRALAAPPGVWHAGVRSANTGPQPLARVPRPASLPAPDSTDAEDDETEAGADAAGTVDGSGGGGALASDGDQVVLMTHVGPTTSGTTIDRSDHKAAPILAGSTALADLMATDAMQRRVLVNIHGHVHEASGLAWVGGVRVVNPGSLKYGGRFGVMTLVLPPGGKWDVEACTFYTI